MHSWGAGGRTGPVTALMVGSALVGGFALTACSTDGTVKGTSKPTGSRASSAVGEPTGATAPSGVQGSPASASPRPDTTVTKDDAAAALKAYQKAYNAASAALDTGALTKAYSGSLLLTYQAGTQDHAGAPWLVDSNAILGSGQHWPAFAVGADGVLDDSAVQQDKLALSAIALAAADRTMLADDNAGQPGSPFLNDDVTAAEQRWVRAESDGVAGASVAMTVTTDTSPAPMAVPLKDGGELVLYGTRISLRISESGHTFGFSDHGDAKLAGVDHFDDGFTAASVYTAAAIDPPDKAAKIQKIGQDGGLVSLR